MQSKQEVQDLMNALLPLAQQAIGTSGVMAPIAGAVSQHGELQRILPPVSADHPVATAEILLETLRDGVAKGAFHAIAILSLVHVYPPGGNVAIQAVQAGLEHADGYAIDIYFPCSRDDKTVKLGEPFASKRDRVVFTAS
jgi:hypothetical protein